MFKIFSILLVFKLLISCSSETSKSNEKLNTTESNKTKSKSINSKKNTESNSLNGTYISKKYLDNIKKTKSIFKSRKFDNQTFYGFVLESKNLISKTPILKGFTVHEGGYDVPLIFDTLKNKYIVDLIKLNDSQDDKSYFEINKKHNCIELIFKNEKEIYQKVENDIQTELRKIVMESDYQNMNENKKLVLQKNGDVQNFKDYVYYQIIEDFSLGIQYDAIVFFKSKNAGNWDEGDIYKFEIKNNVLRLNYIKTNWETLEHEIETETLEFKIATNSK
jgi:hypothetical protein